MDDKLTPLRHRRATGEVRLGTSSNPVAESSNPAVKRFARGGHVEGSMSDVKAKAPEPREDRDMKKALKSAEKPAAKADTDFKTGEEFKMKKGGHAAHHKRGGKAHKTDGRPSESAEDFAGIGATADKDMEGGSLPKGDEFKKGGKAKHKYAKGGHIKSSGDKHHHPHGHVSHAEKHHYAEGGHVTKGVNRW